MNNEHIPIPMVLHCPSCGTQHIDAPAEFKRTFGCNHMADTCGLCENLNANRWDNPPHRSHLCGACGTIWRPADLYTTGVTNTATHGAADTWPLEHDDGE